MDLTKLSTDDLMAIRAGDLSKVSTAGLQQLRADAFGAKVEAQTAADRAEYDPTKGMSGTEKFLSGAGKAMTDIVRGAGQRFGLVSQESIDESAARDAPLMKTGAGQAGAVTGSVATALPAIMIPGANTVAGAGAIGALQGALQPTETGQSVVKNALLGGGLGSGGVVLGRGVNALYQGAKGLVEPFSEAGRQRIVGRTIDRFAADPAKVRAASAAPTMTGANPTLAEASGDAGIATLQRAVEQLDPAAAAAMQERLMANNAARIGTVADVAGTPAKRAAAIEARKAATGDLYQQATQAAYTVDDKLSELLGRPVVQKALDRAKTLAENNGRTLSFNVTAANPMSGMGVPTQRTTQITGQGLQDLKMAMDEMLTDPTSGFAGKAGATVKSLRGQLVSWMEEANPAFKEARTKYRDMTKPLNAMDVGDRLLEKTTSATRDMAGNRRMQANAFARAMNDEETLLRQATGTRAAGGSLADVMTPEQMAKLEAVRNELELVANLGAAANGPGSQTAKALASQNIIRQILGPTGLPESWAESALLQTMLRPVQFAYAAAEPRITGQLANALIDPATARAAIAAAQARRQIPNALAQAGPYAQFIAQQSAPAAGLVAGKR